MLLMENVLDKVVSLKWIVINVNESSKMDDMMRLNGIGVDVG